MTHYFKYILLTLFCVLTYTLPSTLKAQDYVYSVTSGTSWAREEFPKVWQKQARLNKGNKPEEGVPDFCHIFWNLDASYYIRAR